MRDKKPSSTVFDIPKDAKHVYTPIPKNEWKRYPAAAKSRKELARLYRDVRRHESGLIARMIWRIIKEAQRIAIKNVSDRIFTEGFWKE